MRYQAKWNNGSWKLFDAHAYEDIDVYDRWVEAEAAAARMNARDALAKAAQQ